MDQNSECPAVGEVGFVLIKAGEVTQWRNGMVLEKLKSGQVILGLNKGALTGSHPDESILKVGDDKVLIVKADAKQVLSKAPANAFQSALLDTRDMLKAYYTRDTDMEFVSASDSSDDPVMRIAELEAMVRKLEATLKAGGSSKEAAATRAAPSRPKVALLGDEPDVEEMDAVGLDPILKAFKALEAKFNGEDGLDEADEEFMGESLGQLGEGLRSTGTSSQARAFAEPPLLAETKTKAADTSMPSLPPGQKVDMNTMVTWLMMKELKNLRAGGGIDMDGTRTTHSALATSISRYNAYKKRIQLKPEVIIREFLAEVQELMGPEEDGKSWTWEDYSRKLGMTQFRTIFRMHILMGEVLRLLLKGQTRSAAAQLIQGMRAAHQFTLDGGAWRTAWLLTYMRDPLGQVKMATGESEVDVIASYIKVTDDLEKRTRGANSQTPWKPAEDQHQQEGDGDGQGQGDSAPKRGAKAKNKAKPDM